jgi:DNA-binding YbaB/EbfC family protein
MTQNPFGGEGGFDMSALLQQAQQMQEQLMSAQARLEEAEVEGTVAGGAVTVKVSGTGDLLAVTIRAGGFDADDADDLADLGDMVVAAWRDAKARADALAGEQLGPLAGGLGGLAGDDAPGGTAGEIPGGGQPFGFGGPPSSGPGTPGLGG